MVYQRLVADGDGAAKRLDQPVAESHDFGKIVDIDERHNEFSDRAPRSEVAGANDCVAVVATQPLTDNETWSDFADRTLNLFVNGELVMSDGTLNKAQS